MLSVKFQHLIVKGSLFLFGISLPFLFLLIPDSFFQRPEELGCLFRYLYYKQYFGSSLLESLINFINPFPFIISWVEAGECLGCGMTRAFRFILQGHWSTAISLNPLSPLAFAVLAIWYIKVCWQLCYRSKFFFKED